jgi:hypothetical protein
MLEQIFEPERKNRQLNHQISAAFSDKIWKRFLPIYLPILEGLTRQIPYLFKTDS